MKSSEQQNLGKKEKPSIGLMLAILLVLGSTVLSVYTVLNTTRSQPKTPAKSKTEKICDVEAFTRAQRIISEYLKSPSTAEFASFFDSSSTKHGQNFYKVVSYVDAQNSFGTALRSSWTVQLQDLGNCDFIVINVFLDGETMFSQEVLH